MEIKRYSGKFLADETMVLLMVKTDLKDACGISIILFKTGLVFLKVVCYWCNTILHLKVRNILNLFLIIYSPSLKNLHPLYVQVSQEFCLVLPE